ncbi:MAG: hypothetical protein OEW70_08930 [candidate division WOR-3 bacterium]|nr:hypothetical protein [candidate division WOR-3 bacterium]
MQSYLGKKGFPLILILFISQIISAQETHNLEIIWTIPGNPILYAFGYNLVGGDIDNDGRSDIIISADTFVESGGTTPYRGRAYLYYGTSIGDTIPDVVFKSPFVKGSTPTRVHSADINGDSFDDIIIGEDQADVGFGGVTTFWGGNPVDTVPDIILNGRSIGASFFGCAISSGDVNGDSFNDLIVGSYGFANLKGRVYIYFGGPNFDTIPDVILNGGHNNDQEGFGYSASGSGDVNNDGFADIIVGAVNFGTGSQGRIYIYFGGNPMDTVADVKMIGEGGNHHLGGFGVDFLKNNFAYDYAITSCCFWPNGFPRVSPGKIYVLFGGNLMDSVPDVWMIGRTDSSGLGDWTSTAGDINGDSCDDIISGAPIEHDSKGSAYIWLGGSLLDTTADAWIRGEIGGDGIGWHVATAGDINSDGRDEIMVSNYAGRNPRVWVCKYTGPGIEEERLTHNAENLILEISPNPARSVIRVRSSWSVKDIKIYDITGKIIKTFDITKKCKSGQYETKWYLRDNNQKKVAIGIYLLEITIKQGEEIIKEIRKITLIK